MLQTVCELTVAKVCCSCSVRKPAHPSASSPSPESRPEGRRRATTPPTGREPPQPRTSTILIRYIKKRKKLLSDEADRMAHKVQTEEDRYRQWQQEQYLEEVRWLIAYWPRLGTLERGEGVVSVLKYGISMRRLAKHVGCSESTIRNYEIIGLLTAPYKRGLLGGAIRSDKFSPWYGNCRSAKQTTTADRRAAGRRRRQTTTNHYGQDPNFLQASRGTVESSQSGS